MIGTRPALVFTIAGLAGVLSGCAASGPAAPAVTTGSAVTENTTPTVASPGDSTTAAPPTPTRSTPPKIESFSGRVRAEVQVRGTIPYDNMTLPLVSPDGRHVATQTGMPPEWDTIIAAAGAMPPYATRIEIYTVPLEGSDPPQMTASVPESALLGRSSNANGFLIEAPQTDGSRWIGRASWETGEITWLVREEHTVSAFATAAPDGSLAWSSVALDGEYFELVVRRVGEEWRLPAQGSDWLMPTWSATVNEDGTNGLFALMLRGGMLDAVHMDASSESRMLRTLQRLPLANRNATLQTAYQTMNPHVAIAGAPAAEHDTLLFLHPTHLRSAVWTPPGAADLLDSGSFAVAVDSDDPSYVLMSTMKDLVRRKVGQARARSKLIAGPHIARPTPDSGGYILLNPLDGVIGLTRMRLLGAK